MNINHFLDYFVRFFLGAGASLSFLTFFSFLDFFSEEVSGLGSFLGFLASVAETSFDFFLYFFSDFSCLIPLDSSN